MRRLPPLLVAALIALAAVAGPAAGAAAAQDDQTCEFPYSTTDATGTEVTLEEPPETVVALQPSDAQTMWEIGARDQVVGLPQTSATSYLNDTEDLTNVANDDGSTDVEQVVGTDADLVLAANATFPDTVQQLRDAGMTVYHFGLAQSLEDIYAQVEETGRLTGNCEAADETVGETRDRVESVREAVADRDRPRVLYYFYQYTAGNATHIHDLIETAGGQNVAAEAGIERYQELNEEVVADRDPEWIVIPSDAQFPEGAPYDETTAYQEDQRLTVDANYVSQPGPRVAIALEAMAEAFHPEAFDAGENATATPDATDTPDATATPTGDAETPTPDAEETATPTAGAADTPTPTEPAAETTAEDGPGIGIAGALVALAASALLAARRKGV